MNRRSFAKRVIAAFAAALFGRAVAPTVFLSVYPTPSDPSGSYARRDRFGTYRYFTAGSDGICNGALSYCNADGTVVGACNGTR